MIIMGEKNLYAKNEKLEYKTKNIRVQYYGKSVDELVYDFMEQNNIPGMQLAIVQAPYIPRVVGYGSISTSKPLRSSSKTMWDIGDIAQTFTMVAIMQLAEGGKLQLSDTLKKHIPNVPNGWKDITIKQLLQHSTGISDYTLDAKFTPNSNYKPQDLIALVANKKISFKPGDKVNKSATNFLLLAMIVEKVSGESYKDYIYKNQIHRLGLKNTIFADDLFKINQEIDAVDTNKPHKKFLTQLEYINPGESAFGYGSQNGQDLTQRPINTSSAYMGHGGIWASAEDVSFWDIALASRLLIKEDQYRNFIFKPSILDGGSKSPTMAGWNFTGHKGFTDIGGNVPGFSSYLSRFTAPEDLVCVTLLANKEGLNLVELGRNIAAAFKANLGSGLNSKYMITYESGFEVKDTLSRLEANIAKMQMQVFAKFDHGDNAKKANLSMNEAVVVVFGNPSAGTKLMQNHPSISLDLPLKISIWKDEMGRTWVGYHSMKHLAKMHDIDPENEIIQKMETAIQKLVTDTLYQ